MPLKQLKYGYLTLQDSRRGCSFMDNEYSEYFARYDADEAIRSSGEVAIEYTQQPQSASVLTNAAVNVTGEVEEYRAFFEGSDKNDDWAKPIYL